MLFIVAFNIMLYALPKSMIRLTIFIVILVWTFSVNAYIPTRKGPQYYLFLLLRTIGMLFMAVGVVCFVSDMFPSLTFAAMRLLIPFREQIVVQGSLLISLSSGIALLWKKDNAETPRELS